MPRRVDAEGPKNASIMLIGEAPGTHESAAGLPFRPNAPAGKTLNVLLSQAGIARSECRITNVAKEQPPKNNIGYFFKNKAKTVPTDKMIGWIQELKEEIEEFWSCKYIHMRGFMTYSV